MASEWRTVSLEDVSAGLTVGYVGPMATEYVEDGVPFLRSLNVEPLRINRNDLKFITPEFHARLSKSALEPGTVVIVRTGKPGACCVVPDWLPVANCSDLVIVRCGPELNPDFLAYYVNTAATGHVAAHLVGAVQQHFNVGSARTMKVLLPPIQEQRSIVHVLRTMDEKIELNRKMNETLEAMARALFKSWFVDLDPVLRKGAGRNSGLPDQIAALFPSSLEGSSLGEIPTGWTVEPIGNLTDVIGGTTPSTKEPEYWTPGTHAWATPKDLSSLQTPILLKTERRISDSGLNQIGSGLLPVGTVLLSSRAPIGYLAVAEIPVAINQGFIAMKAREGVPNLFLLYWAEVAQETIKSRANGSTFLEISKSNFRRIEVVRPSEAILQKFDAYVRPWYERIVANEHETANLIAMRDALLPKLISGEMRVGQLKGKG